MISKIVTTTEEFYSLKDSWEKLQEQDVDVSYYSTFEYLYTWWNIYKKDTNKSLFIICIYNNEMLIGIAPFMIEKHRKMVIKWNELYFLGRGDFLGFILLKNFSVKVNSIIKTIFNLLESNCKLYDKVNLTYIKYNSSLAAFLLKNINFNSHFCYQIECPCIEYTNYNSYEEFEKKVIGASTKSYFNKFTREVKYNFKVINNKNDYNVYSKISELHIKEQQILIEKMGKLDRRSIYNDENYSEFVKNIFENNDKVITFIIEDLEGNIMIYATCYLYKGILHGWNTAYDTSYAKYNLGRIINIEISKYILKNKMADFYDLGAGRYPWKFEWTSEFIFNYELKFWNNNNINSKVAHKLKDIYSIFKA